jgi:hypothetical protein
MEPEVQWFIAREGTQHGPLSDVEMKKLVELSYLRPTDLIWRQGFPDWRPALAVFPRPQPGAAPSPTDFGSQPSLGPAMSNEPRTGRPAATMNEPSFDAHSGGGQYDEYDDEVPYKSGRGRKFAIAAVLLLMLGAGGYLGYLNRDSIMTFAAQMTGGGGFATGSIETPESVDSKLQKAEPWIYAKQEFPEWYKEQIDGVAKLTQEKKTDLEITRYLVSELVKFRRTNSDMALQAPSNALRDVAVTFRETLVQFGATNTNSCYQFISHGESSDPIIEIMRKLDASSPVQKQLNSIFVAVAEGKKSPIKREGKAANDIETLTAELKNVGWSEEDTKLFFDPKAFSRAPPERVCQMVQDLFTALLAIKDPVVQDRLLVETLRHVMAG